LNRSYRSVWNSALGAWVAVSEINRARAGKGGKRGLAAAAVAAAMLTSGAVHASDIVFKGTSALQPMTTASNWVGGVLPGLGDRAVISGSATSINAGGASIGAMWITSTAAVTRFSQLNTTLSLAGIDGVGIRSDSATQISMPVHINLLGDIALQATNATGGGLTFPAINNVFDAGIYIGNHTLTLDTVNAVNTMNGSIGVGIFGTGNVIKTGAGTVTWTGPTNNSAFPTSLLQYTGYTDIQQGTFSLIGIASLVNSSSVRVNGTLDISATADGLYDTTGTPGGSSLHNLSGSGRIELGARNLRLAEGSNDFAGVINGTGKLVVDSDATVLRSASTYSGGTDLKRGRLDVGDNAALGTGTLSMDDGTTLGFIADGLNLANAIQLTGTQDPIVDTGAFSETLSGAIAGTGLLTKQGTGTLTLSGTNTYTGATNVAGGILRAGAADSFSAGSAHTVAAGAALDLAGFNQTIASMNNSGIVSLPGATAARTTLTVRGPWVGQGGALQVGLAQGAGGVVSDRLVLDGAAAVASGRTTVQVANTGLLGAMTSGNGVEVVTALNGGTTTAHTTKDAFSLAGGHVDAGAFEYRLYAADATGAGENWYLRSEALTANPAAPGAPAVSVPTYRSEVPQYGALPEQLRMGNFVMLSNLHQRVGDDAGQGADGTGRQAWARVISADRTVSQSGAVSPGSDGRLNGFQAGTDLWAAPAWHAGVYVGQLDGDMRVNGFASGIANLAVGSNDLRSQYLGAYTTYHREGGFYADTVLQAGHHRYDVSPDLGLQSHGKGDSLLASIEVGQGFGIGSGWVLEPQLQVMHQRIDLDDASIVGATVQQDSHDGWIVRAGLRVKGEMATAAGTLQPYGRVNVYRSGRGTDITRFVSPGAATDIATGTGGTSTEFAAGATLALTAATSLYGEIGKLWASGGDAREDSGINGSIGVKMRW
jgi:outer membrane autotransporter protein